MKKGFRNRKLWGLLALLLCVSLALPAVNVQAASKKSQAIKAYKDLLNNIGNKNNWFSVLYLDNDSVPELIMGSDLYTFRNGKIVKVHKLESGHGYGYYKKKGVLVQMYAHFSTGSRAGLASKDYSKFSKSKLTHKLYTYYTYGVDLSGRNTGKSYSYHRYNSKGVMKKTSKAKFNSELRKMVGKKKMSTIQMRQNTAANRNKYIK